MDVAHGANPYPTSPPPRPAIPPKPDKEKIGSTANSQKTHAGTQASFRRFSSDASTTTPFGAPNDRQGFNFRTSPLQTSENLRSQPKSTGLASTSSSPPPVPGHQGAFNPSPSGSRTKPALPPKPNNPSLLNSPPVTKFPSGGRPSPIKIPLASQSPPPRVVPRSPVVDNANNCVVNNNNCVNVSTSTSPNPARINLNGDQNGSLHSPPPFLRNKPPSSPQATDPISPRVPLRSPNSRPNSTQFFNFSSPIQNLNSANFPSTSGGLDSIGGSNINGPQNRFTSPQRLGEIRTKSASLGRNITFPFSSSNTSGGSSGIAAIISRKSATLSKFLPLDLQIGSSSNANNTRPPAMMNINASKPPKPNSLNLNPFIIQQKQQQQSQMAQQKVQGGGGGGQAHPILNFGRSISFSPDSPLPPPPPPRLRKKLSPVNSLGSPTSPTSPDPIIQQAPTGPLPMPPMSPPLSAFEESDESKYGGEAAIYAEIDKKKKWEERKLKFEQIQFTQNRRSDSPVKNQSESSQEKDHHRSIIDKIEDHDYSELNDNANSNPKESSFTISGNETSELDEPAVVHSWLGKYIKKQEENSALPDKPQNLQELNPSIRSNTPTYQSTKTGHIYETIGDPLHGAENENNNNHMSDMNSHSKSEGGNSDEILQVHQTSEKIEDGLSENQSFLFKLVINPKIVEAPVIEQEQVENEPQLEQPQRSENDEENEAASFVSANEEIQTFCENDSTTEKSTEAENKVEEKALGNGNVNEVIKPYLIPTVIQEISTEFQPSEQNMSSSPQITSTPKPKEDSINIPSRNSSILRRRSWNGDRLDRVDSPSPSESSSTTSSSISNPYHRRDISGLSEKSNRDSLLLRESDWADEGDLSNGALADAESSDVPLRSSAEDLIHLSKDKMQVRYPPTAPGSKGFASRRSRLVNSFFGSFGKGSSSSSGSSSGKKYGNPKRGKDRTVSQIIGSPQAGTKLGRQVSDSIISHTVMISSPIISNSTSFDSGIPSSKPSQSVQFSPDVTEKRIIYQEHYSSAEEGLSGNNNLLPGTEHGVIIKPCGGGGDDESVSSSESVAGSASGSVSGYEDILAELSPKEKKSFYVAREILTSERTFVDVLNLLTIDFPKTVDCASKFHGQAVIPKEDLDMVLGGLPNLKRVNEELLNDLEERVGNWKEFAKIADILVKKGPFLKLYATYIKDFQKNSMHLDCCCQRYPLFGAAIKDFEMSERCQKLGLKHYMLKPVQRMPQYRLLLEDYLKSLDKETSEDYEDTIKGIAIVKDVAEHANEAIRLQVNAEKLMHLQNRLSSGTIILKSDRQLIKEGELEKVCRKALQPRFFALMNDCLLCLTYHASAGSPKDLKLRYELPLAGMRVQLNSSEDYQNEFSVISVTRSFNLVAKSSKERDDWMKVLNNAIQDNIKKRTCSTPDQEIGFQLGKEAPVWIQDSRVTMCQLCTAEFTTLFRRHHCRACGKVVCGNCSGNQAPLQYDQNAPSRVCDFCYEYLLEEFDKLSGLCPNDSDKNRASLRDKFKKVTPNVSKRATKIKSKVPSRLEVCANSSGSRISGYLHWREKEKKSWKKRWFVLIDRVLYIYAASEDIVALKTIPLLGWKVQLDDRVETENEETNQAVFRLTHDGHHPILFQAENNTAAEKWMAAMNEAVVL